MLLIAVLLVRPEGLGREGDGVIDVLANESFLMLLAIYMVAAVGMNLVYVTGQLNLGQAGFLAVGAYTLAVVDATWSWPLPLSLLAGAVAAGIVAFPIAVGANRVRGIYLIMGTLAVGEVIRVSISNIDALGGLQGYSGHRPRCRSPPSWSTLAVVVASATLLMGSPIGLTMRSIFDDEDAAAAAGVATRRVKIASVVLSAAVVGVAGGLLAKFLTFIAPDDFDILVSFEIALYTLIGGTHSVLGALGRRLRRRLPARAARGGSTTSPGCRLARLPGRLEVRRLRGRW